MKRFSIVLRSTMIDLHGILLRETIRKVLGKENVAGWIENKIEDDTILLDIQTEMDEQKLQELVKNGVDLCPGLRGEEEEMLKSVKITIKAIQNLQNPPPQYLTINKSNPQWESAWALKGAGKIFLLSLEEMKNQRKEKILGVLDGLNSELSNKIEAFAKILEAEVLTVEDIEYFSNCPALRSFLIAPPVRGELVFGLNNILDTISNLEFLKKQALKQTPPKTSYGISKQCPLRKQISTLKTQYVNSGNLLTNIIKEYEPGENSTK